MVCDLTGMEIANASLLDEGTAAAEAMTMTRRLTKKKKDQKEPNRFFVSDSLYTQTIDVLKSRAEPLDIELVIGNHKDIEIDSDFFGCIIQYPGEDGNVHDFDSFIKKAKEKVVFIIAATDLMSLTLLKSPAEFGADVAIGSSQRFGVPLGYGGPHAAFFATREEFVRNVPGRIIGLSIDNNGNDVYRMALQTREQHIRRDKATSNICTAQALLAIMAGMYAIYHGPEGIKKIGSRIHHLANILEKEINTLGYKQLNEFYFDTLQIDISDNSVSIDYIESIAISHKINLRYLDSTRIGISIDETTDLKDVEKLVSVFASALGKSIDELNLEKYSTNGRSDIPSKLKRKSLYLTHPIFNTFHSETKMLRYIKTLEKKDLSLTTSMIPLGSCTMKLNATTEMLPVTWPEFSSIHPFVPVKQVPGYTKIISELETMLCKITGFDAVSLQPNSGAQGEYSGLKVIREFHKDRGHGQRDIVLIPSSAHGTNPASAIMVGMKVVVVKCDDQGNIDIDDIEKKISEFNDRISALMITYPSTHGVFEEKIREICDLIHDCGGQVYMDGANMNAQAGLTNPAIIGADVCHLNLHKTFSIPHGGGGPGMGPICVAKHLEPYLPGHSIINTGGNKAIDAVSSTPWGSPSILIISHAYVKLLGEVGVTNATKFAILNANYIKARLESFYPVLYQGANNRVAHELIFDLRQFKKTARIDVEDVAKRLMDYGFHAPTVSFPVAGTIMVEPTESESKDELDRFCDAMVSIREEIREIENGESDVENNVLRNAPHTVEETTSDEWNHGYSRQKAVYPMEYLKANKFWPPVGRVNNSHGDRNLVCTCPPIEAYQESHDTELV